MSGVVSSVKRKKHAANLTRAHSRTSVGTYAVILEDPLHLFCVTSPDLWISTASCRDFNCLTLAILTTKGEHWRNSTGAQVTCRASDRCCQDHCAVETGVANTDFPFPCHLAPCPRVTTPLQAESLIRCFRKPGKC